MAGVGSRGKTNDGSWRPDTPFSSADGLKVTMRRAANLTPAGVLRVPMRFQTPPVGDFRRPFRTNWSTFDTVAGGQRSRPMGDQLMDFSIDTILMDRLAADATSGVVVWDDAPHPQRILGELNYIRRKKAVFRLVISQPAVWGTPVINMVASLTAVDPTQRPGHLATEFVSLSFLEFPESSAGRERSQRSTSHETRSHDLKPGDTLYKLATRYLHKASDWRVIAKGNGIKGVSPGGAEGAAELAAWAKRNHKKSLKIPRVEHVARFVGDPTYS